MPNMKRLLLALLVLFVILSEIILKLNPLIGFIFYFVFITACLFLLSGKELDERIKIIIVFLIIPILRLCELFLELNIFWKTISFYYLFLFLVVFYSVFLKIDYEKTKTGFYLIIASIIVGILFLFAARKIVSLNEPLLLILLPVIAFSEEMFFRGLLQKTITNNYNFALGIIISSIFYVVFSFYFGFAFLLVAFAFSLISAIFYQATKSLKYSIILNFLMHLGMLI